MLRACAIFLIGLYQRFLSPYKGFRCAYAAWHGGPSCSAAIKDLIREHGVFAALPGVRQRFSDCRAAYVRLNAEPHKKRKPKEDGRPKPQREKESCLDMAAEGVCEGVCDSGCDGVFNHACDAPCDIGHCS